MKVCNGYTGVRSRDKGGYGTSGSLKGKAFLIVRLFVLQAHLCCSDWHC